MNITINGELILVIAFVFFIGYMFGRLIKNFRWWKILPILVFGAYFESIIRSNKLIFITTLFLGFAVNYISLFFSVLSWAGNFGDLIFALRYRSVYEDLRRREEELDERERKLREEERRRAYGSQEQGSRPNWQQEAKGFRQKQGSQKAGGSTGAGRGGTSSSSTRQQSGSHGRTAPPHPPPQNDVRASHLQALGLKPERDYNPDEIKKAYRQSVKKAHPDMGGSQTEFIKVQNAYEWLRSHK